MSRAHAFRGTAYLRSRTPRGESRSLYMCIYACICMYMHVYACICMYMRVYACMCAYMRIYVCVCMYTRVYACICVYMRVYARLCASMCIYACICVYVCVCDMHSIPRIYLMVFKKHVFKTTHRRAKPAKNASGAPVHRERGHRSRIVLIIAQRLRRPRRTVYPMQTFYRRTACDFFKRNIRTFYLYFVFHSSRASGSAIELSKQ